MAFFRFGNRNLPLKLPLKKEWKDIVYSPDFSCTYELLEGNVLVVRGRGFTNEETERDSIAFGQKIINQYIPADEKFCMIQDWREYRNSTAQARKLFMDFVIGNDRLALLVFCNCTLSQSLSIKLGRSLGFLKSAVLVCGTNGEALRAVTVYRNTGYVLPEKTSLFRFPLSRAARYNEALLEYLESVDWSTGKWTGTDEADIHHPLLPVFDTITVIRSGLERTFLERDRAEKGLREYQENLESLVRERTAAMEASEQRYRLLLRLSPAALAVFRQAMDVEYVNEAFVALFGYTVEKMSAAGGFFACLSSSPETESELRSFVSNPSSGEHDFEFRTAQGTPVFVQVSLNSLVDTVLLSFTDVTDRIKSETRLFELSLTDELTGIYNRRHFVSVLSREMQQFSRYGNPLALLVIDIDHFKSINDSLGHQSGDAVLRELTARISAQIRDIDYFFRIGGEEFAVVMPNTDIAQAAVVAERLRFAVGTDDFVLPQTSIRVSVSVGLATASEKTPSSETLFGAADALLYRAKNEGRNRVCRESTEA